MPILPGQNPQFLSPPFPSAFDALPDNFREESEDESEEARDRAPFEDENEDPAPVRPSVPAPPAPKVTVFDAPATLTPAKSGSRQIRPEDYDAPLPTDQDFPRDSPQTRLPALKLDKELPANVLTETQQKRVLGWDTDEVRVVNHQTGIFTQLPMICAGTAGCEFGKICPVKNRDEFIGKPCPLEIREVFKHFSGYVLDLGIKSTEYTDLQSVADLVRLHLVYFRTDMAMKTQPEIVEEVAVVAQKSGDVYYRPAVNKNRELQETTRAAIQRHYKDLLASRAERRKAQGGEEDAISQMMARISGITTKRVKE
jgi:hypothetical protein